MSKARDLANTLSTGSLLADGVVSYSEVVGAPTLPAGAIVGTAQENTFTTNQVISDNSANAALRITQVGTGNALLVEDSANPDSTPLVIDAVGRTIIGSSSSLSTSLIGAAFLQVQGGGNERPQISVARFSADNDRPRVSLLKSRSATVGVNQAVQSGDVLGAIEFMGADGSSSTGYPIGAQIKAEVDGTPGTNDMPGRLVFGTTPDNNSAPTERLRISANGVAKFSKAVQETKVAMGANDIDLSAGNYFTKTISGATTLTVSNVASSGSVSAFVLELTNGGSAAVTFFSGVTWAAATPPTLTAAGVDTLAFFTSDGGTTWRGFVLGLGMA